MASTNPNDSTTVIRFRGRHVGWPTSALTVAALGIGWLPFLLPDVEANRQRQLSTQFILLAAWLPIGLWWTARVVGYLQIRDARQPWRRGGWQWWVTPVLLLIGLVGVNRDWPQWLLIQAHRPALDSLAADLVADGPHFQLPDRQVGWLIVRRPFVLPDAIGFEIEAKTPAWLAWFYRELDRLRALTDDGPPTLSPKMGLMRAPAGPPRSFTTDDGEVVHNPARFRALGNPWYLARYRDPDFAWVQMRRQLLRDIANTPAATVRQDHLRELVEELGPIEGRWEEFQFQGPRTLTALPFAGDSYSFGPAHSIHPKRVADVLRQFGPIGRPALVWDAAHPDLAVRTHAFGLLLESPAAVSPALVMRMLGDPEPVARMAGLAALRQWDAKSALPVLVDLVRTEQHVFVQDAIVHTISRFGRAAEPWTDKLLDAVPDDDRRFLVHLLRSLRHRGDGIKLQLVRSWLTVLEAPDRPFATVSNHEQALTELALLGSAARQALPTLHQMLAPGGKQPFVLETNAARAALAIAAIAPQEQATIAALESLLSRPMPSGDWVGDDEQAVRAPAWILLDAVPLRCALRLLELRPGNRVALDFLTKGNPIGWAVARGLRDDHLPSDIVAALAHAGRGHPALVLAALRRGLFVWREPWTNDVRPAVAAAIGTIGPPAAVALEDLEKAKQGPKTTPAFIAACNQAIAKIKSAPP